MANASSTISAPSQPAQSVYEQVVNFLKTGSLTPTITGYTAPQFRSGSATQGSSATNVTQFTFTVPGAVAAGDLMVLMVSDTLSGTYGPSVAGWASINPGNGQYLFYKFATSADLGMTFTVQNNTNYNQQSTLAWAFAAYSGVDQSCPVSCPGWLSTTTGSGGPSTNLPVTVHPNNLVVLGVGCQYENAPPTTTTTGWTLRASQSQSTTEYVGIYDYVQATAGQIPNPTFTGETGGNWATIGLVLNGAPTYANPGTVPAGGWNCVGATFVANNTPTVVWQSPQASNNVGATWYLIIQYNTGSSSGITFAACEYVDMANVLYNALVTGYINYNNYGNNQVYAPGSNQGGVAPLGPSETVPWSWWNVNALQIGTSYAGMTNATASPVTGTNQLFLAANKDGFFFSLLTGGSENCTFYFGAFTSLVTNPQLSDNVCLTGAMFRTPNFGGAGQMANSLSSQYPNYINNSGVSRDPGVTNSAGWGGYYLSQFYAGGGVPVPAGRVGGDQTGIDIFQSPNGQPIATRVQMYKQMFGSNMQPNTCGILRGILPNWMQYLPETNCVWGDTVSESSDSLTLVSPATSLWVDTTAA